MIRSKVKPLNRMTVRLFLFVVAILVLLVFSSQQFSSSGQTSAREQAQKEQANSSAPKPLGGDIPAARSIVDPHPAFVGVAVDPVNDIVVMADTNRKSVVSYDRRLGESKSDETSAMRRQIIGPQTNIGFVAGVAVDSARREFYAVNNDIEDTMMAWSYDAEGNAKPSRLLAVPHQAWGLALSPSRNEIAVSIELQNAVVIYRREAVGLEAPIRYIRGAQTGMADPHGVSWDERHNEIAVANHGNFRGMVKNTGLGCMQVAAEDVPAEGGQFQPPSLTIYSATASGDEKPLRTIQGAHTQLDWPMGIDVDAAHEEIAVANNGDNSILIFRRTQGGDVAPLRAIRGPRTGINRPMGVSIDTKNNEIWVSNFGEHTALVFARDASGDAAPRRI